MNILIFPTGSESAMDIYDSLCHNPEMDIYGTTIHSDHSTFIYPKDRLFVDGYCITKDDFIVEFNRFLKEKEIDYIIPTHDTIASYLTKHSKEIVAEIVCSPYETAILAEDKALAYAAMKSSKYCIKLYDNIDEIEVFPVFIKPAIGAGAKGTVKVTDTQELIRELEKSKLQMLVCEFLPGDEYTVDCFTNSKKELLFVGPRTRGRVTNGISMHSERVKEQSEFMNIANYLNDTFDFRGAWFFQVKRDAFGQLKILEFSVRQAGTMTYFRQLGINFAEASILDLRGDEVTFVWNDLDLVLDRRLKCSYDINYNYEQILLDSGNTLVVKDKVNTGLIQLLYQWSNQNKKVVLIGDSIEEMYRMLEAHHISSSLFYTLIENKNAEEIDRLLQETGGIYIDGDSKRRVNVNLNYNIPVFNLDSIGCLKDPKSN